MATGAYAGTKSALISPTPLTTFSSETVTFIRDAGVGVTDYAIHIGITELGAEVYSDSMPDTSVTIVMPVDGQTIYVTLYSKIGGLWQTNNYTYIAVTYVSVRGGIVIISGSVSVDNQDTGVIVENQDTHVVLTNQDTNVVVTNQDTNVYITNQDTDVVVTGTVSVSNQDTNVYLTNQDTDVVVTGTVSVSNQDTDVYLTNQDTHVYLVNQDTNVVVTNQDTSVYVTNQDTDVVVTGVVSVSNQDTNVYLTNQDTDVIVTGTVSVDNQDTDVVVTGLVGIVDGSLRMQIDPYTLDLPSITFLQGTVFAGNMYEVSGYGTLDSGDTLAFCTETPATDTEILMFFEISNTVGMTFLVYEDAECSWGTSATPRNFNRNYADNSSITVLGSAHYISGTGTLIYSHAVGATTNKYSAGGTATRSLPIVLKTGTQYVWLITSTANDNVISYNGYWSEFVPEN